MHRIVLSVAALPQIRHQQQSENLPCCLETQCHLGIFEQFAVIIAIKPAGSKESLSSPLRCMRFLEVAVSSSNVALHLNTSMWLIIRVETREGGVEAGELPLIVEGTNWASGSRWTPGRSCLFASDGRGRGGGAGVQLRCFRTSQPIIHPR